MKTYNGVLIEPSLESALDGVRARFQLQGSRETVPRTCNRLNPRTIRNPVEKWNSEAPSGNRTLNSQNSNLQTVTVSI
jgi:hypothetical protein